MKDIPLDLSALAYPMMRTKRSESNYRFVAELTTPADPRILTESLSGVLPLYPVFRTRVAPSFFWHVLRPHDAPLVVKEDDRPPLVPMRKEDTHGYPFRLAYREKEIIFEVFHAVTDANVAALFLTDLLTRYAEIIEGTEPTEIPTRDLLPEDAFLQCGRKKKLRDISLNQYNGESVYSLGERGEYRDAPETLSLEIPLSTLLENARGHDATITEYIAAAYITAILEQETLPLRKSLCLFIPIDLRRYCPSHTMQNFVCFERIYLEKGESDLSFDHILAVVHEQFLAKITPENMQDHVDDVRRCFTLPLLKYTPLASSWPLLFTFGQHASWVWVTLHLPLPFMDSSEPFLP